jgi:hypothetical protein
LALVRGTKGSNSNSNSKSKSNSLLDRSGCSADCSRHLPSLGHRGRGRARSDHGRLGGLPGLVPARRGEAPLVLEGALGGPDGSLEVAPDHTKRARL